MLKGEGSILMRSGRKLRSPILKNSQLTDLVSLKPGADQNNRRSSEIQGTALGKCLQAWPVHIYTGPGLRV